MSDRFTDALAIQQGACNPAGIALALHKACKECLDEGMSQRTDPAVRLIAHQLAFILNVAEIDESLTLYADLTHTCKLMSTKTK